MITEQQEISLFMLRCQNCSVELSEDDFFTHNGRTLCEDCYLAASQRIRVCDPWAERSKKIFRETHGLSGTEGLTDLQKKIYEFIQSRGKATHQELVEELDISPQDLENQFALLRHCQLVKGKKEGDQVYLVLW